MTYHILVLKITFYKMTFDDVLILFRLGILKKLGLMEFQTKKILRIELSEGVRKRVIFLKLCNTRRSQY